MFHFIILDDDQIHNIHTNRRLEAILEKHKLEGTVALNTTFPGEVIEYCSKYKTRNNIYLLDVNVQTEITGIDVGSIIRKQDAKAYIVFISAHPEFVLPSLKTKVFDYLIKPVSQEAFEQCILKIVEDFNKLNIVHEDAIYLKSGFTEYKIEVSEITFLEKFGHILVVHTVFGQIQCSESLDSMEKKLAHKSFFRCHKSYIVNLQYISKIDYPKGIINLKNGQTCPVSKRCKKELRILCSVM